VKWADLALNAEKLQADVDPVIELYYVHKKVIKITKPITGPFLLHCPRFLNGLFMQGFLNI